MGGGLVMNVMDFPRSKGQEWSHPQIERYFWILQSFSPALPAGPFGRCVCHTVVGQHDPEWIVLRERVEGLLSTPLIELLLNSLWRAYNELFNSTSAGWACVPENWVNEQPWSHAVKNDALVGALAHGTLDGLPFWPECHYIKHMYRAEH